jgi:hypothetical protein
MAMTGLLRNMGADLVGRGPGTAEYEITLTPRGTARTHLSRASARTVPNAVLNCPGPVADQE